MGRRSLLSCLLLAAAIASPLSARVWKDASGTFSVEAELVRVADGKVELRKEDGRVISVPLEKLSRADRDHLATLEKPQPVAPKPSTPKPKPGTKPAPRVSAEQRMEAALRQPAKFEFVENPLTEIAAYIAKAHEIPVWIDFADMDEAGLKANRRITGSSSGKSLGEELEKLLGEEMLAEIRHGVLVFTTPDGAAKHLSTRVYRLLKPVAGGALKDDIARNVAPKSWSEVGGAGSIEVIGNVVVVLQTDRIHSAIQTKYDTQLKRVATPAPPQKPAALDQVFNDSFIKTPLSKVAETLATRYETPIEFDKRALTDAGIATDTPVSFNVRGIPLASALHLLLAQCDATWHVQEGKIIITTDEARETKLVEQRYNVRDLTGADHETLSHLLISTIDPETWEEVGGLGSIEVAGPGALAIKQTARVHAAITQLLADLRAAPR